ncbi:MAG: hypothetical protein ACYC3X_22120 [Pirellulaceae bacterium]
MIDPQDLAFAFQGNLQPLATRSPKYTYVAGVDLGVSRDASAVVCLGIDQKTNRIRLVQTKRWLPTPGNRVDLIEVARWIDELDKTFKLVRVSFDPWQSTALVSLLEQAAQKRRFTDRFPSHPGRRQSDLKYWAIETPATASNLREQASQVVQWFSDRRLDLYDDEHLKRDLQRLRVQETSYGFRLSSPHDEWGHGDSASAFALALQVATKEANKKHVVAGAMQEGKGKTAMDRAWDRFERDKFHEEMCSQITDDGNGEWNQFMSRMGRR